jgi:type II secretory pathway component PulF
MGFACFCLLVLGCIRAMLSFSRTRAAIIFRHLGLIVQQNLPLPRGLELAAESESGATSRVLRRLSHLTETGMPLPKALSLAYQGCPALPFSIVEAAERTGTLPAALRELNERLSRAPDPAQSDIAKRWMGFTAVFLALLLWYMGFVVFLTPKFGAIFADYDVQMPPFSREVLAVGMAGGPGPQTLLGNLFRLSLAGVPLLVGVVVFGGVARLGPRRAHRSGVLSLIWDFLNWHIPPLRTIAVSEGCANAIPTLRLAAAAGWPLPDAIQRASEVDANYYWRRRLEGWARQIRGGTDAIAAGRQVGLPETFLRYLSLGMRDGDLDGPLYHAESYYACLLHRWKKWLVQLAWPLATIYLGVLVGAVCLAVVLAVRSLIDVACASVG